MNVNKAFCRIYAAGICIAILYLGFLCGFTVKAAQAPVSGNAGTATGIATLPPYEPSEVQALRLQVKQRDAQIAQIAFQQAQVQFQQALAELNREADRIKTENKWPKDLVFKPETLKFEAPPSPPHPASTKP